MNFLSVCIVFALVTITVHQIDAFPMSFFDFMASDAKLLARVLDEMVNDGADVDEESFNRRSDSMSRDERCGLPIRKGHCRALIPRFRYNPATKQCSEFKFGGCDGNSNNFSSYKQCMAACKGV